MDNPVLKTSADDLYELVKSRKRMSVEEAAKILKMPPDIVQDLVNFLVEEKIFGIEYKFTTPYIYISQKKEEKVNYQKKNVKKAMTKDEFFQKASKWSIPSEKINDLWTKYVEENLSSIEEEFYMKAGLRDIPKDETDALWKKYLTYLY